MRLSPKYVFLGIVVVGLPFAVTMGWVLGTPAEKTPVASAPGGAGGLGTAPLPTATSQPVTAVEYSSRPPRPGAAVSTPPPSPASVAPPISAAPTPTGTASASSPPALTLPPVPTPTEILNPPPSPSATPSGTTPTEEPGPTEVAAGQ